MTTTTAAPTQQTSEAKTKHTPGPWAQEWHEAHVDGCTRPALQARIVAGPRNMTVVACPFGNGEENWKANARLIAQAPAMFDVLVKLAGNGGCDAEGLGWAIADARAILAAIDGSES